MTHDEQLIEHVVREVMQSMQARPAVTGAQCTLAQAGSQSTYFDEPVVTQDVLERRLNGAAKIDIAPQSILTPAAVDFLRSRRIDWTRRGQTVATSNTAKWAIATVQQTDSIETAVNDLKSSGSIQTTEAVVGCDAAAADWAFDVVSRGSSGAIVLSDAPEVVACLANRQPQMRAAVVGSRFDVATISQRLGANLFCLDARRCSFFELRNILRAMVASPPPAVPDGLTR